MGSSRPLGPLSVRSLTGWRHASAAGLLLFCAACGSSPTGPSATPPPPVTYPISGTVTATNGGQPLAGATIEANGVTATTDGSGHYTLTANVPAPRFTLTGPGLVTRTGTLHGDVDAFGPGFDLGYFRQIARGALDNPDLQPIRRWTSAPSIYVRTVDEAGAAISPATLAMVTSAITSTASAFTGGAFGVQAIEQGTETREGAAGWVTVKWLSGNTGHCGTTPVAMSGGYIALQYQTPGCSCGGFQITPTTVKHELGHAFGLWHSSTPTELMTPSTNACDREPSLREREYAAYLYRRPVGSTDEDHDPN